MYISGLVWWQIIIPWHPKHVHVGVDFSISRQNSISWGVTGVILVNREMYKTCVSVFSGAFFVFVLVTDFCIFVQTDILEYDVWEHRWFLTVNMHGYNSWEGVLHIYWVYICKATLKSITSLFIFHWHSVILMMAKLHISSVASSCAARESSFGLFAFDWCLVQMHYTGAHNYSVLFVNNACDFYGAPLYM